MEMKDEDFRKLQELIGEMHVVFETDPDNRLLLETIHEHIDCIVSKTEEPNCLTCGSPIEIKSGTDLETGAQVWYLSCGNKNCESLDDEDDEE